MHGRARWLGGKESACQCSVPGLSRSAEVGDGSLLQESCLGSALDREALRAIVDGVAKSQT